MLASTAPILERWLFARQCSHRQGATEGGALIGYQKSIRTAFREVSDSLEGYRKTHEQEAQQQLLMTASSESVRLSNFRYRGGLDSFLQVLDAERNLFTAELALT